MEASEAMEELGRRRRLASGSERGRAVERHRARGGLTGQDRIDLLVDPGSFRPTLRLMHSEHADAIESSMGGDGALHGFGTIGDRPVGIYATDPTVKGATTSPASYRAYVAFKKLMARCGVPYIDLRQGGGARIPDIMTSRFLGMNGGMIGAEDAFGTPTLQLCAVLGDYYAPWNLVSSHFSVMTKSAVAGVASPLVLQAATGQQVTPRELGGADVHARVTGEIDAVADSEADAIASLKAVFEYLPSRPGTLPPIVRRDRRDPRAPDPSVRSVLPQSSQVAYDMHDILDVVLDTGSLFEFSPAYAPNLITGLARLDGVPVAVFANQPRFLAGSIDVDAMNKARRLLRLVEFCGLPMVNFVDTPGVLTTVEQEHARLIQTIHSLMADRHRPAVPKLAVVVRKGIGLALFMSGAGDEEALTILWPSARVAFTGPEPAARVLHYRELEAAPDPVARQRELADEMRAGMEPWIAARLAYADSVIDPAETRPTLIAALHALMPAAFEQTRSQR